MCLIPPESLARIWHNRHDGPTNVPRQKLGAIFRAPFTCKGRILWGNGPVPSILRKKPWLSIRRCPLHANPEELVLEVIAAFLATQGPCTGSTSFGQLSLRGLQLGNQIYRQICRSMMSIFHHKNYKNLVSFAGRVASSKQPSMAKQQRLVVSIIAILDPFRSYHFRWWVEVSCAKCLIGSHINCSQEMSRARWHRVGSIGAGTARVMEITQLTSYCLSLSCFLLPEASLDCHVTPPLCLASFVPNMVMPTL